MKLILQLKTWVLFLIFFVPFLFGTQIGLTVSYLIWILWIYAIVIYGQDVIRNIGLTTTNIKFFKFNLFFIVLCLIIQLAIYFKGIKYNGNNEITWEVVVLIPLAIYSGFAIFYILYVASMTVAKLYLKREVNFWGDVLIFFLRICFYPLGVWGIQPIMKKLV